MKKRGYKRVADVLAAIEKHLIAFLLVFDVVLTAANVFSRYVIHKGWSFTEEIVVAVLVLMSLIGAALCARTRGGLINLTMVTDKMSKRAQDIVDIFTTLLLIGFAAVMVKYGIDRCVAQAAGGQMTTSLQIPEWYYNSFIPLGGVLLIVHSLEHITDIIFELIDGKREGGDGKK